jgi:excisionase family DNA binding protein
MIKLFTTEELAAMLNVSPRTIRRERASGRLPFVRIRKQVRYRESDVQQYLGNCVLEQEKSQQQKETWMERAPLRTAAQAGFSLMETVIVVTVMALISAVMVPAVSDFVGSARMVRAQHDVRVLSDALTRYTADSANQSRPDMGLTLGDAELLVSEGEVPADDVSANDNPDVLASASFQSLPQVRTWSHAATAHIEQVFVRNTQGKNHDRGFDRGAAMRTSESTEAALNLRGARGPYLAKQLQDDPWGNRYMINVGDAPNLIGHGFRGARNGDSSAVFVVSAGPDRKVQTARGQSVQLADVKGDDIALRIY